MEDLAAIHPGLEMAVSRRARRLALRLDPKRRVMRLVVPYRASRGKALAFARDHKEWIHEKLAALPQPVPFVHGAVIPVLGRDREIYVSFDPGLKRVAILLENNKISIFSNRHDISGRLVRFLKKLAEEKIRELAFEKAGRIGKKIKSIQIRDTKSRWGSCASDGRLSFSWRLVFAPPEALDYLVGHEVAHMVHLNHGPKFWTLCEQLSDNYAAGKEWIRSNGNDLMRYGV